MWDAVAVCVAVCVAVIHIYVFYMWDALYKIQHIGMQNTAYICILQKLVCCVSIDTMYPIYVYGIHVCTCTYTCACICIYTCIPYMNMCVKRDIPRKYLYNTYIQILAWYV